MDLKLAKRSIRYHGVDLIQKLKTEQQEEVSNALVGHVERKSPVPSEIRDEVFQERLQTFIAKKSDLLFRAFTQDKEKKEKEFSDDSFAIMPPLETFMGIPSHYRREHFYSSLRPDDCVTGVVVQILESGLLIRLLCQDKHQSRDIVDLDIMCYCPAKELPKLYAKEDALDVFQEKDIVRGIVLTVSAETERIIISLLNSAVPEELEYPFLGLISEDDLPVYFRRKSQIQDMTYSEMLPSIMGFNNSGNVQILCDKLNIPKTCSYLRFHARLKIPEKEYAEGLKKWQSQKLAHKSVAQGVEQFKQSNHVEAMQHFSRALQVDPSNVEALVARGALYANKESYNMAIQDFEEALGFNPNHSNAKNYLVETLLAYGKSCEDAKQVEEALVHFEHATKVDPENAEAKEMYEGCKKILELQDPTKGEKPPQVEKPKETVVKESGESNSLLSRTADKLKKLIKEDAVKQASAKKKKKPRSPSSSSRSSSESPKRKKKTIVTSLSDTSSSPSPERKKKKKKKAKKKASVKGSEKKKRKKKKQRSGSQSSSEEEKEEKHIDEKAIAGERGRKKEKQDVQGKSLEREKKKHSAEREKKKDLLEQQPSDGARSLQKALPEEKIMAAFQDNEELNIFSGSKAATSFLAISSQDFFSKRVAIPGLGSPSPEREDPIQDVNRKADQQERLDKPESERKRREESKETEKLSASGRRNSVGSIKYNPSGKQKEDSMSRLHAQSKRAPSKEEGKGGKSEEGRARASVEGAITGIQDVVQVKGVSLGKIKEKLQELSAAHLERGKQVKRKRSQSHSRSRSGSRRRSSSSSSRTRSSSSSNRDGKRRMSGRMGRRSRNRSFSSSGSSSMSRSRSRSISRDRRHRGARDMHRENRRRSHRTPPLPDRAFPVGAMNHPRPEAMRTPPRTPPRSILSDDNLDIYLHDPVPQPEQDILAMWNTFMEARDKPKSDPFSDVGRARPRSKSPGFARRRPRSPLPRGRSPLRRSPMDRRIDRELEMSRVQKPLQMFPPSHDFVSHLDLERSRVQQPLQGGPGIWTSKHRMNSPPPRSIKDRLGVRRSGSTGRDSVERKSRERSRGRGEKSRRSRERREGSKEERKDKHSKESRRKTAEKDEGKQSKDAQKQKRDSKEKKKKAQSEDRQKETKEKKSKDRQDKSQSKERQKEKSLSKDRQEKEGQNETSQTKKKQKERSQSKETVKDGDKKQLDGLDMLKSGPLANAAGLELLEQLKKGMVSEDILKKALDKFQTAWGSEQKPSKPEESKGNTKVRQETEAVKDGTDPKATKSEKWKSRWDKSQTSTSTPTTMVASKTPDPVAKIVESGKWKKLPDLNEIPALDTKEEVEPTAKKQKVYDMFSEKDPGVNSDLPLPKRDKIQKKQNLTPRPIRKPKMDDPRLAVPKLSSNQLAAMEKAKAIEEAKKRAKEMNKKREKNANEIKAEEMREREKKKKEKEEEKNGATEEKESEEVKATKVKKKKKTNDDKEDEGDKQKSDKNGEIGSSSKKKAKGGKKSTAKISVDDLERMIEERVQQRMKEQEERLKLEAEKAARETIEKTLPQKDERPWLRGNNPHKQPSGSRSERQDHQEVRRPYPVFPPREPYRPKPWHRRSRSSSREKAGSTSRPRRRSRSASNPRTKRRTRSRSHSKSRRRSRSRSGSKSRRRSRSRSGSKSRRRSRSRSGSKSKRRSRSGSKTSERPRRGSKRRSASKEKSAKVKSQDQRTEGKPKAADDVASIPLPNVEPPPMSKWEQEEAATAIPEKVAEKLKAKVAKLEELAPKTDSPKNLTDLEKFLKDLKQNKKKQWIAEGKIKEPE